MAIKKGNVRLQVTVSEDCMKDLEKLCSLTKQTKSRAVSQAIWEALVDAEVEAQLERKEERESEGQ